MNDVLDTVHAKDLLGQEVSRVNALSFSHCWNEASRATREQRSVTAPTGVKYAIEAMYLPGDDPEKEAVVVVTVAVEGDMTSLSEVIHKTVHGE